MFTKFLLFSLLIYFSLCSCSPKTVQNGKASYYHDKYQGKPTASGEKYRNGKLTAAHQTLPFGTRVTVKNLNNGKKVKVKINDRGPFVAGRIIDLSKKGARKLDMIEAGVAPVEIRY
jgi:rare lipoprotein A